MNTVTKLFSLILSFAILAGCTNTIPETSADKSDEPPLTAHTEASDIEEEKKPVPKAETPEAEDELISEPDLVLSELLSGEEVQYEYTEETLYIYEDAVIVNAAGEPMEGIEPSPPFDKVDVDIKYPQFYGLENLEYQEKLNTTITEVFGEVADVQTGKAIEGGQTFLWHVDYKIAYSNESLISIVFSGVYAILYEGRYQPFAVAINFNLNDGNFMEVANVFTISQPFVDTVFKNKFYMSDLGYHFRGGGAKHAKEDIDQYNNQPNSIFWQDTFFYPKAASVLADSKKVGSPTLGEKTYSYFSKEMDGDCINIISTLSFPQPRYVRYQIPLSELTEFYE